MAEPEKFFLHEALRAGVFSNGFHGFCSLLLESYPLNRFAVFAWSLFFHSPPNSMAETVLDALTHVQANTQFYEPIPMTVEWRAIQMAREDNGLRFLFRTLLDNLTPGREDSIQDLYNELKATSIWKSTIAQLRERTAQLQACLRMESPPGLTLANLVASVCQLRSQLLESSAQDQATVVARLLSLTARLLLRAKISALLDADCANPTALVGGRLFVEQLLKHSDLDVPSADCEWSRCIQCNKIGAHRKLPVVAGIANNHCVGCTLEIYGNLEQTLKNTPGWEAHIERLGVFFDRPSNDDGVEQELGGFISSGK